MKLETFFEKFDQFADAPDAVAKIRELILQLAVQGRLVEPANNDEPVGDFLRRIWSDKSGNRVELTDAEKAQPFELPPHWRWVVLAEVAEFLIGKTPPRGDSSYWYPEDYSWVSIADMKHYGKITETKEKVSALAAREVFRQRFAEPGSILMSFKLTIGKVARAGIRCFHNEAIISLQPPEPELIDYLYRFLPIFAALQTSNNAIKGSTLNKGLLRLVPIALPPLAEQKQIVAKVDELMTLCDRLQAQQQERKTQHAALARSSLARFADAPTPANLNFLFHDSYTIEPTHLRKSILTLAVQGKLVPQDPNDEPAGEALAKVLRDRARQEKSLRIKAPCPVEADADRKPDLPCGWCYASPDQMTAFHKNALTIGPFGSSLLKSDYTEEGVPLVFVRDIRSESFGGPDTRFVSPDKAKELASHTVRPGDLLITKMGDPPGDTAIYPEGRPPAIITADCIKLTPHNGLVSGEYLRFTIRASQITEQFARITLGVAQQKVSLGRFRCIAVPLPPLAEQRRIVAKADELMALVDHLETQLAAFRVTAEKLMEAIVIQLTAQE
jgi:type I restriction enzyme, S subunit